MRPIASTLTTMKGIAWSMVTNLMFLGSPIKQWRWAMRRARKGSGMLFDPGTHLKVVTALRRPALRPILEAAPQLVYKYLTDYLKTGLSRKERASILTRHYLVLGNRADRKFFTTIVGEGVELWREAVADHAYSIVLKFPQNTHAEGDLQLVFRDGTFVLYSLAFTIGPGRAASAGDGDVMYITRIQGRGGALDSIRRATKDCLDISPPALLLEAAEGMAMELDLERIIGISAHAQLSFGLTPPSEFVAAYDEFWMAVGGEKHGADLYRLMVPRVEKPLLSITRSHRSRTRKKRAFKRLVRQHVRARFRESLASEPVGRNA